MPGVAEADLWRVVSEAVESTAPFEVAQDALWVHVRGASGPTTPAVLPGQIVAMVAEGGACVGSAFVRGFDPDAGTIHVLTDVDEVSA